MARRTVVLSGTVAQFSAAFNVQLRQMSHAGGGYRGRTGAVEFGIGLCWTSATGGDRIRSKLFLTTPAVVAVSVDHAANSPTGDTNGPDGEVMLDVEVVGAIAPQANIAVYFAPNTDAGFLNAITTAVHDTTNRPSVVSISWGGPESSWTAQAMTAMDDAFQAAAAMGITVWPPQVERRRRATAATRFRILSFFALPSWQTGVKATGNQGQSIALSKRGVPDVAGNADPNTGYVVRIDGTDTVIGGTSAVAPLCGRRYLLASIKCRANPQAMLTRSYIKTRRRYATSVAATTATTPPPRAGMPAPASGVRMAARSPASSKNGVDVI